LFGFVVGCSVYVSAVVSVVGIARMEYSYSRHLGFVDMLIQAILPVVAAWLILWRLYAKWRLPGAVTILRSGPVTSLCLLLLCLPMVLGGRPDAREFFGVSAYFILIGAAIGILVSFPAAVLMMLSRAGSR
jgi:hypothetical protein